MIDKVFSQYVASHKTVTISVMNANEVRSHVSFDQD